MSARTRVVDIGLAATAAAQLGAAAWLVPVGDRLVTPAGEPLGALCLSRTVLGVDCPFCGMARSFVALAHGQLGRSIRFHPAGPILFGAMAMFVAMVVIVAVRRGRPLVERRRFVLAFEAVAALCLVVGVFHNVVRS